MSSRNVTEDIVPRRLLDEAMAGVERLKQRLDEDNAQNKADMDTALQSFQWQLRTLQAQCRTAEDQLQQSLEREAELRAQVGDPSTIISKLGAQNDALRTENDYFREQVAILMQDAKNHADLKPELELRKQQMLHVGTEHYKALSSLAAEKDRLATEATEALAALRNELEIRTQNHEEEKVGLESRVNELWDNLTEARSVIVSAEVAAETYSTHNALLEKYIAKNALDGRRIAEQEAEVQDLQMRIAELQRRLQEIVAEHEQKDAVITLLESREVAAELSAKNEREILLVQIEQQKRGIEALVSQVHRSETDAIATRDQMREGLKRAENENKQLRENFIETRDKLELAQQNHRKALNDLHDQTLSTARREEDMKEKMKAMNKEFYKEIQGLEEASRSQVERLETKDRDLAEQEDEVKDLQKRIAELQRRLQEIVNEKEKKNSFIKLLESKEVDLEVRVAEQEAEVQHLQKRIAELQKSLQETVAENEQKELSAKNEREILLVQIEQQKRGIEALVSQVHRSETDAIATRDQMREEFKRAESENKQLRESCIETRDKLELAQQNHQKALNDLHDQTLSAARREEDMKEKMKALKKELQDTVETSIPESEITQMREEAHRGKKELVEKLQQSHKEIQGLEEASRSQVERLETKVRELGRVIDGKDARVLALSKDLKKAEEEVLREQKQRQNLQEQVLALTGDLDPNLKPNAVKQTKMAEATIEILEKHRASFHEKMACTRREEGAQDALQLCDQRSAIGIVLNGTQVLETVAGSPAHSCGMIDPSDELLMVDGQKVTAQTVTAALRGSDSSVLVVSLVLRKSGSRGELVKVDLPRMSIDMVKQRQMLNKSLKELQENLVLAFSKGAESEVAETLGQLTKQARLLDRMSFEFQMQLSAQLSAMVEGVEELVSRAKTSVLCIDGTHQQVHLLQALTESELRQQLMQDSGHNAEREEMKMNRQLQELEGDLKAVIEELNSTQMLKSDCVEDLRGLKRKVQELEDEIIERQKSQDLLMSTLSRTEDELSEERVEMAQLPYALRAEMDVDFEDTVANAQAKAIMDAQLQNDISIALRIPKSQVEVLCYTRGHGTMAEVKISPATSIPSGVDKNDIAAHGKSGRALAEELQRQILDADSEIHYGLVGKRIKKIELHGPIAVPAARALRSALLEAYGDLARAEKDMLHAQEKFSVTSEKHRAAIKEEELIKQEIVSDCNARMKAASEGFRKQLDFQKEQVAKEQATVFKGLNRSLQDALDQHKLESRKKITELQATNQDLENELKAVREVLNAVEVKNSTLKIDVERAIDRLNHSERNFTQMKQACRKVDDILMPELSSCLMTLNNIESEMGFFHTRIMRALESSHSSQEFKSTEALRSKDCIEKDMSVLRLQLEILSHFSYSDPRVLLEDLSAAVAFAENPSVERPDKAPVHNGNGTPEEPKRRNETTDGTDGNKTPPRVSPVTNTPSSAKKNSFIPSNGQDVQRSAQDPMKQDTNTPVNPPRLSSVTNTPPSAKTISSVLSNGRDVQRSAQAPMQQEPVILAPDHKVEVIVEVTLFAARNLPNVDGGGLMGIWGGSCDAFVELACKDKTLKSTVKKNSLDPDWNPEEKFEFNLLSGELADIQIQLKDWNPTSSAKLLGTTVIGVDVLKLLMAGDKAAFPSDKFLITAPAAFPSDEFLITALITAPDGKPLVGKDKQQTHLVLKVATIKMGKGSPATFTSPQAREAFSLHYSCDLYNCDFNCGFRGGFEQVSAHEPNCELNPSAKQKVDFIAVASPQRMQSTSSKLVPEFH